MQGIPDEKDLSRRTTAEVACNEILNSRSFDLVQMDLVDADAVLLTDLFSAHGSHRDTEHSFHIGGISHLEADLIGLIFLT